MFFSIIVPCYNCDETIRPLLDSILIQEKDRPGILAETEVLLVDDTEDHSFRKKTKKYEKKLNIRYIGTDLHNHNPGNSRNYGLKAATGNWVLFIDCDDTFRPGMLKIFEKNISTIGSPCHFAKIKQYHPDGREYTDAEDYQAVNIIWTHGKCYNRDWLMNNDIWFKPTMKCCEDMYFNYQVWAQMLNDGFGWNRIDEFVYNWLWNNESLSRSNPVVMNLRYHFYDHIEGSLMPWVKPYKGNTKPIYDKFVEYLLLAYFIYQYHKRKCIVFDKQPVREALSHIWEVFGITILDIINDVEDNYKRYHTLYQGSLQITNEDFVCPESFREWMMGMYRV